MKATLFQISTPAFSIRNPKSAFRNRPSSVLSLFVFKCFFDEQILAPFGPRLGVVAEKHALQADAQSLLRSEQRHARLFGRAAALARVAVYAGRHEVFGRRATTLRTRRDVVERQLARKQFRSAILTAKLVA